MNPLHTTREVGEAIQKALPSFETEKWHWWDKTGGTYRGIFDHVPHNPQGGWCYAPAPTLHETLIAIRELGKVRKYDQPIWKCEHYNPKYREPGERGCDNLYCEYAGWKDVKEMQHTLLDTLIATDLDLSHPSVSEYLIKIFNEK